MFKHIKVLDCSFRDGGYYNNWDFDDDLANNYFDGVARLPIDVVEVGYCNQSKSGYGGRYFFLTAFDLDPIKKRLAAHQRLAIMLNAKDCPPDSVHKILGDVVGIVDVVRIAVSPKQLGHGLALACAVRDLGFEVGFNLMYLSSYAEHMDELSALAEAKGVVDSFALVDSYGSVLPDSVAKAIKGAINLLPGVDVGFHGHDNLSLAFANTLAAISAGATVVDGTFVGIGRGAGNLRTELFLVFRSLELNSELDYDALSSVVAGFERLRTMYGWGTNLPYMISGAANLPQGEVMDWLGKNRYSVVSILRALHSGASGSFDEQVFKPVDAEMVTLTSSGEVMILGGGPSVARHLLALARLVKRSRMPVMHANMRNLEYMADLGVKQIICLAGHGVNRLPAPEVLHGVFACVVAEPPRFLGTVPPSLNLPVRQVKPFAPVGQSEKLGPISDIGPLSLALGSAVMMGAKQISLAGFDGYANATVSQQELANETECLLTQFRKEHPGIEVRSVTPSMFDVPMTSVYARLVDLPAPAAPRLRDLLSYHAVVFDCDGVLFDSNGAKIECFRLALRAGGFDTTTIELFSDFQRRNFGLSRHVLFDRLLKAEFGPVPPTITRAALLEAYGAAASAAYLTVPETSGVSDLLRALASIPLFVVSGSDETELRAALAQRNLAQLFQDIYGSPMAKADNLSRVRNHLTAHGLPAERMLFIGDAEADADAATAAGYEFVFLAKYSAAPEKMEARSKEGEFATIETLCDFLSGA